jgi:hypothetical protein
MVPRHRVRPEYAGTGYRQAEPLVSGLREEALTTEPRYHTGPPFRTEPQRTVLRRPVQDEWWPEPPRAWPAISAWT